MTPWTIKMTQEEKLQRALLARRRRRRLAPTRAELSTTASITSFCQRTRKNTRVQECMQRIARGEHVPADTRDLRTVEPSDRLPRSLEHDTTPPRYWFISSP